jgi:hypothetical protein
MESVMLVEAETAAAALIRTEETSVLISVLASGSWALLVSLFNGQLSL